MVARTNSIITRLVGVRLWGPILRGGCAFGLPLPGRLSDACSDAVTPSTELAPVTLSAVVEVKDSSGLEPAPLRAKGLEGLNSCCPLGLGDVVSTDIEIIVLGTVS